MWCFALRADTLEKNKGRTVDLNGVRVAVFNLGGKKFHALLDACIHRGASLGEGHVEHGRVTCPWHAWEFDIKNGKCFTVPDGKQKTFPTKLTNGDVFVDV